MIAEQLAGKRIAITGSTGFVGTALVERLLRSAPGCELILLVRPSRRHSATERVRREIFKNNAFDRLKRELQDVGAETFDAILLDVDNGPGFLIHDQNARVYAADWLTEAADRLNPGGVLAIWSESPERELAATLEALGTVTERLIGVERAGRRFDYALYLLHSPNPQKMM